MKQRIQNFYDVAYEWLLNYGLKILFAIVIFFVGQMLIRILRRWINKFFQAPRFKQIRSFLEGLVAVTLQIMLLLLLMQILGIQMTIFAAAITAFGVAAGLALSGTLQNFASGVLILLLRPYRIGDNIITQGLEGTVSSIQLFYTVVTSFDNKTIIVPNSKLSNIELKLSFATDTEQVKKIIEQSILASKTLLTEPTHCITVSSLEPDGYRLLVNVWVAAHGFNDAKFTLQERMIKDLQKGGVKLPGM